MTHPPGRAFFVPARRGAARSGVCQHSTPARPGRQPQQIPSRCSPRAPLRNGPATGARRLLMGRDETIRTPAQRIEGEPRRIMQAHSPQCRCVVRL